MKLQFFFNLFAAQDSRATACAMRCPAVRALPYTATAANDPVLRPKPHRFWRRNPVTGRLEMHWTSRD